jgi:hypothetical protein
MTHSSTPVLLYRLPRLGSGVANPEKAYMAVSITVALPAPDERRARVKEVERSNFHGVHARAKTFNLASYIACSEMLNNLNRQRP